MTPMRVDLAEINNIFMQFGQNLGLGNLSLDENGLLSLVFDDHLMVELQLSVETGVLFFVSPLSAMPEKEGAARLRFLEQMLHAPLTEGNLAGAFFCLDPESEEILLMRALDASSLTTQNLESDMERFVNALDFWSSKTKNGVFSFEAPHNLGEKREDPSVTDPNIAQGKGAVQI